MQKEKQLSRLKVALVHDFLMQWGGAEQILLQFTKIFPNSDIFTICSDEKVTKKYFFGKKIINSYIQKFPNINKFYKAYIMYMPRAIESFNFEEYDLVLSDSSAFAKGVIVPKGIRHICFLHTPTRYLWDIPDYYISTSVPALFRPIFRIMLPTLKKWDLKASKRPDKYIVISDTIRQRTIKNYNRIPDALINPFFDEDKFTPSGIVSGDYYLIASRLVPYKRFDIVVKAFNKLKLPLKIIGSGYGEKNLKKLNTSKFTKFYGFVSEKELIEYYKKCKAYIFPAYEDFGITVVEAMACGKPVIAYKQGGAGESIIDGKTGILINNQTEDDIINAVDKINKTKFDNVEIRRHALKFSKKRFTNEIVDFISKNI